MVNKLENTIFVSGINYNSKEEDILKLFEKCGQIVESNFPKYQDSNRLLGYAHLTFDSQTSLEKALEMNKTELDNRYLEVQKAKGHKQKIQDKSEDEIKQIIKQQQTRTIFIKNLSYNITEDQLGDHFKKCGKIENVRFVRNSVNNKFKGFAYIDFVKSSSLFAAIKLNNTEFKGRKMFVDIDLKKPKRGFRLNMSEQGNKNFNNQQQKILKSKNKKIRKNERYSKQKIKNYTPKQNDDHFEEKIDNLNIFN